MSTTTVRNVVRPPALDRDTALRLAATEYGRFAALLGELDPQDWTRRTDCAEWDVRAMAGHALGMAEMVASLRQFAAQNARAARAGGGIDALTALQVRDRARLSPGELVDRFVAIAPRAVDGRRRLSRLIGRFTLPEDQVVGGRPERWTFGFLVDVILTRDTWMHRMDLARATGREPALDPGHDGVLVDDVVAEWAQRHGSPYRLHLTGPAGGAWASVDDGPEYELDAVEFCRVLSGRGSAHGLLAQQVPF
ncbi:MAG: hypothetical protein JWR45_3766 [Blastococcus sp.]|jgi:uncharacterized protein (TIGR03083 family)|nr:hypothetical protein [Blastococcus sp.]